MHNDVIITCAVKLFTGMSDFLIVWGITKQIVADVIGDYWKLFPLSWNYYPPPSASGSISNFGEIISNSHLDAIKLFVY